MHDFCLPCIISIYAFETIADNGTGIPSYIHLGSLMLFARPLMIYFVLLSKNHQRRQTNESTVCLKSTSYPNCIFYHIQKTQGTILLKIL